MRPPSAAHILIAGGSSWGRGGLERYCDRLAQLLNSLGCCQVSHHKNESAIFSAPNRLNALYRFMSALWRLLLHYRRSLRRPGHSFVWLQYGNAFDLLVVVVLSLVSRKHLVCTLHASDTWMHLRHPIARSITYLALRLPARVFVLAEFQASELRDAGLRDVRKIPTLLPDWVNNDPVPIVRRRRQRLLFVGRVTRQKGFTDILHLARTLTDAGNQFTFTIVGPIEAATADVERDIETSGLQNVVRLVGECDEAEVLHHLRSNDIFLYPSYVDTYPLALLEAAVAGLYVIAYRLKGSDEILRELGAGVTVPIGDRVALTKAVIHALTTDAGFTLEAKAMRSRFTWSNVSKVYLNAVQGLST